MTLVAHVAAAADRVGADTPALIGLPADAAAAPARLTYRELLERSKAVAAELHRRGVGRGDAVAVWLPNVPEWLVVELAAARLGCRVVPVNTRYREAEIRHVLTASHARAVVAPLGFLAIDPRAMLGDWTGLVLTVRVGDGGAAPDGAVPLESLTEPGDFPEAGADAAEEPLNLFVTSGTSASPKIVVHAQSSLVTRLGAAAERFDIRPGDVMLCALPLCGVWGLGATVSTLLAGGTVVMLPTFDPDRVAEVIGEYGVTHMHGGDDMLLAVLSSSRLDAERCGRWRSATFGNFSGRPPGDLFRAGERLPGLRIAGAYGSSEAICFVAAWPASAPYERRVLGGGPLTDDETRAVVVDPADGTELPPGTPGELRLGGGTILRGYLDNPEATRENITSDGWLRTGDLAEITEDGAIVFHGRLKDSLRLRGFLVDPAEIEECLLALPGVEAAQVVGATPPDGRGEVAVAFVRAEPGAEPDPERLRAECRGRMAAYKVPERVIVLDAFPTVDGPNGSKVRRVELRRMAADALAASGQEAAC